MWFFTWLRQLKVGARGGAKTKISQSSCLIVFKPYLIVISSSKQIVCCVTFSVRKNYFVDHLNIVCLFLAGLLGMELASNFSDKASSVTCVGRSSIPFTNVLGEEIGSMLKKVMYPNYKIWVLVLNWANFTSNLYPATCFCILPVRTSLLAFF